LQKLIGIDIGELVPFKTDMGFHPFELLKECLLGEDPELNALCLCFSDVFVEDPLGTLFNPKPSYLLRVFLNDLEYAVLIG